MFAKASGKLQEYFTRVLLVGAFRDWDLLASTLDEAGFNVQTATIQQALEVNPGVLILADGLPMQDRMRLIRGARRRDARVRVILLYRGSVDSAELADAVLSVAIDPKDLVQTIWDLTC